MASRQELAMLAEQARAAEMRRAKHVFDGAKTVPLTNPDAPAPEPVPRGMIRDDAGNWVEPSPVAARIVRRSERRRQAPATDYMMMDPSIHGMAPTHDWEDGQLEGMRIAVERTGGPRALSPDDLARLLELYFRSQEEPVEPERKI